MKKIFLFILLLFPGFFIIKAQNFQKLGTGLRITGTVRCIEFDSVNNRIFIAGYFSKIDHVEAINIAMHDSSGWHAFGIGTPGYISCMKYVNGKLFVAGQFDQMDGISMNNITYWDGTSWNSLGGGIQGGFVRSMEWFDSTLFVSGYFTYAGGNILANHVARWDGTNWMPVGSGSDVPDVYLKLLEDTLFAYGKFENFNGISADHIISFDGTNWQPWSVNNANLLLITISKFQNKLTGSFYDYNTQLYHISNYDNGNWNTIASNLDLDLAAPLLNVYANRLYFNEVSNLNDSSVLECIDTTGIIYNVSATYDYGADLEPHFYDLKEYHDSLFVVGSFMNFKDQFAASIATLNDTAFGSIPFYCTAGYQDAWASAFGVTMFYDSAQNKIITGGRFDFAGDTIAHNIAAWNGTSWEPMGEGLSGTIAPADVWKIIKYNGQLFACGRFQNSGNQAVNYIAQWNGISWTSIGTGANDVVKDMEVYNNELYISGSFDLIDGIYAPGIAKYDGISWSAVPGIQSFYCSSLCIHDGKLVALGLFYLGFSYDIVAFDGSVWQPYPNSVDAVINADAIFSLRDTLFIATVSYGVLKYDTAWSSAGYNSPAGNSEYFLSGWNDKLIIADRHTGVTVMETDPGVFKELCYYQVINTLQTDSVSIYATGFMSGGPQYWNKINHIAKINVQLPIAQFSFNPDTICDHEYVFFQVPGSNFIQQYEWDFPGGVPNTSTSFTPVIKYNVPGSYDVGFKVTGFFGSDSVLYPNLIYVMSCPLETEEYNTSDALLIYPNPVFENLYIKLPGESKVISIYLTDIMGRKFPVKTYPGSDGYSEITIDCSSLSKGMYLLSIQSKKEIFSKKFIKQ